MEKMDFVNPGKTYRPAPFWSWNGTMRPDEVRRQARLMSEQGFGGFFMHSRVGLESPYMGVEWMDAVAASILAAMELDMEAWFYDEDKWPSGFAGGMVPALGDDYRLKGLEACLLNAADLIQAWEEPGPGLQPGAMREIYQLHMEGERLAGYARLAALPDRSADGLYMLCQMRTARSGQPRFNGESYVDLMDAKVTEAFIKCTHEAYKERFGHLFGPHAPGIFTDEPNVAPLSGGLQTPWTPALPARFQELWGYDLRERLPLLFLDGEGCKQVRHDYWATITILFRDNFTKPFGEWCERNGVIMTGHYLHEDTLVGQAMRVGAAMPHYPYMQLPGIDHLGRNINNPLTLKQVSSVAHQMGQKRVLCEIFGIAGHSMSFADQKWISDFHFALGINFLNPHLTLYSMLGERKRDYPANISWAQPYWPYYRAFNDYAARCSWFAQRGDFRADILLLHPIGTTWSLLPCKTEAPSYEARVEEAKQHQDRFLTVFNALLADHRDFDLGDELVMADHAAVEGSELRVGIIRYKVAVLPYCSTLEQSTLTLLRAFLQAGGKVYLVGDDALADSLPGAQTVADAEALLSRLATDQPRLVSVLNSAGQQAAKTLYQQRTDGERQFYFFANTDLHQGDALTLEVAGGSAVTVFDPTSGEVVALGEGEQSPFIWSAVKVLELDANHAKLLWQAPPAGSLMISVGEGPDAAAHPSGAGAKGEWYAGFPGALDEEQAQELTGPWAFSRLHPNVLTLDYCRASIDNGPMTDEFKPVAAVREEVMAACGRTTQIQPYRYLTGKVPEKPVSVQLEFNFFVEAMPSALALVVEQPEKLTVLVNGQPANKRALGATGVDLAVEWLGDKGFGAFDVKALTKEGLNSITLSFTAAAAGADVEEIYLLGDFGVWQRDGRYVIGKEPATLAPGSWTEQGYPFYSGTMRYQLSVQGPGRWLDLSNSAASLLRVSVNGAPAQILPWRPWVVDVSRSLQPGENTVTVDVVSSLRNAFGPLHHKRGDLISVSPADFRVNPAFWTDEYHFAPYGLLGPARLA